MSILLTCTHCGHVQPLNFTPPAGSTVYCQRCGAPQSANVAAGASGARAAAPDDEPPSAVLPPLPGGYRAYGARVEVPAEHGAAARPAPAPAPSPAQAQAEGATTASGAVRQAGVSPTPQTLKVAMEVPPGEPSGLPGRSDAFPETGAETESGYGSSPDALAGGRQPDLRPLRPPLTVAPPVHDGLQDYALEDVLGRGGMGVVYRAVEMHLNRPVALKMMNPSGREEPGEWEAASQRFEQEAMVTGKLQHPGIVPVYQLDRAADGTPFYTMRPIEGRSLRDILQALLSEDPATQTEFPLIRLVRVLAEACRAVAYAHDERVIHRDLKPGNIMVGKYGEVLVIDWGLAKCMDGLGPESIGVKRRPAAAGGAARATGGAAGGAGAGAGGGVSSGGDLTGGDLGLSEPEPPALKPDDSNDGYIIGTPAFMPPEQTFGAEHITTRSDVYSLGTILYQILTLTPPFNPEQALDSLLDAIRYEQVQPPAERAPERNPDPELSKIAMRCLNKLPQDRPETAAAVVVELDHWLEGRPQFELVYRCDQFSEREVKTRWFVARGEWECIDGSLQPIREENQAHYLLMFREPMGGDLRITVKGTILDDPARPVGAGGQIGLVTHSPSFRGYQSNLIDGYVAEAPCQVEGQPAVKLVRNDVDIAYGDWPLARETTEFECSLEVLNARYSLTVNGEEVLKHTEFVQLPGEYVGLYTYGPAVLIHAVKIEAAGLQERVSSMRVAQDLVQGGHPDVAVEMLHGLCTHFEGRELSAKAAFQAALIKIDAGDTGQLDYFKKFIRDTVYAPFADLVDYQWAKRQGNLEQQADAIMRALHRSGAKLARQVALQEACAWEHGHRRLHREVYHRSFVLLAMLERQEWDAESRDRIRDRLIECYTQLDQRLALPYLRELAARPAAIKPREKRSELSRPETAAMTLSSWVGLVEQNEIVRNLARTQHLTYHQVLTLPLIGRTGQIREYLERAPMPPPPVNGREGLEYFRFSSLGWWQEIQALEEQGYNFNTSNASAMAQLLFRGELEEMAEASADGADLRLLILLGHEDRVRRRLRPIDSRLQALQASHHQAEVPSVLAALGRTSEGLALWEFHADWYGRGSTHAIARIMLERDPLRSFEDWRWQCDAVSYVTFLGELGLALQLGGRENDALKVYRELVEADLSRLSPYTWQQQWARRTLRQAGLTLPPLAEPARVDLPPQKFAQLYLQHLGL